MKILISISYYFLLFFIYSVIGYIAEMIYTSIGSKKLINRGFLIGPYLPIYGSGCLLITILLKNFIEKPFILFLLAMIICMVLEYITSYIMENIFNARWWDYSNNMFNINGRVCLETSIPFGIGGLFIMYIANPFITKILTSINERTLVIISIISLIIFVTDFIASSSIIFKLKKNIFCKKDNTEEIHNNIKEYILNYSVFTKRLIEAFPNIKLKPFKKSN